MKLVEGFNYDVFVQPEGEGARERERGNDQERERVLRIQ